MPSAAKGRGVESRRVFHVYPISLDVNRYRLPVCSRTAFPLPEAGTRGTIARVTSDAAWNHAMARKRHQRAKHAVIHPWPNNGPPPEEVAERARYVGSSEHKDYESDAGPPALRSDAARCDPTYTAFAPITGRSRRQSAAAAAGRNSKANSPATSGDGWTAGCMRPDSSTVCRVGTRRGPLRTLSGRATRKAALIGKA